jgi:hypothetical protein
MRNRHREPPLDRSEPFGHILNDPLDEERCARVAAPMSARQAPAEQPLVDNLDDQSKLLNRIPVTKEVTRLKRRDSMVG